MIIGIGPRNLLIIYDLIPKESIKAQEYKADNREIVIKVLFQRRG
jgi:hypothetical protein